MATTTKRPKRPKLEVGKSYRIAFSDDQWQTEVFHTQLMVRDNLERSPAAVNAWISRWLRHHPERQLKIEEVEWS